MGGFVEPTAAAPETAAFPRWASISTVPVECGDGVALQVGVDRLGNGWQRWLCDYGEAPEWGPWERIPSPGETP